MDYLELINRYWQEVDIKGWTPIETEIYFRLLDFCNRSGWRNPFALPNPRAVALMAVTENTLAAGRDRLVMKGLIGFRKGSRRSKAPLYCFPEKINGEWVFPDSFTSNFEAKPGVKTMAKQEIPLKERSPIPPKEYIPKESEVKNNISSSRTREEIDLERFDSLLQEVVEGKHQIWEDQMQKKHGIDCVLDYLPAFRNHVIANARVNSVTDINGFKGYFNRSFRFFTRINPIELLGQYEANAKGEKFKKFCAWLARDNPNVARGVVPLSEDEFDSLFNVYDSKLIFDTIRNLNEREDLISKYFSLYRTLLKWLKNE